MKAYLGDATRAVLRIKALLLIRWPGTAFLEVSIKPSSEALVLHHWTTVNVV